MCTPSTLEEVTQTGVPRDAKSLVIALEVTDGSTSRVILLAPPYGAWCLAERAIHRSYSAAYAPYHCLGDFREEVRITEAT